MSSPWPPDALVVHCAASGLQYPPLVPIWGPDAIRLQTIRVGFPCFCAALAGYVEATRDDDGERNRLCPPNLYGNSAAEWARDAGARHRRGRDLRRRTGHRRRGPTGCALNPSRIEPWQRDEPAVQRAAARLADHRARGLARLAAFGGDS